MNDITKNRELEKFACPCCGYKTFELKPNGTYDICQVCFWEDDLSQLNNPDYVGGANKVSLRQGQQNFAKFGACEEDMIKSVRKPTQKETRENNWKPLN